LERKRSSEQQHNQKFTSMNKESRNNKAGRKVDEFKSIFNNENEAGSAPNINSLRVGLISRNVPENSIG